MQEEGHLTGVFFTSPGNGWMSGDSANMARLYHSSDSGNTWISSELDILNLNFLGDIYFLNDLSGWVIGYYNGDPGTGIDSTFIIRTTDGGNSWQKNYLEANILNSVYFTDNMNGWVGGYYNYIGKTSDGGMTWVEQETPVLGEWYQVEDVYFTDLNHGWASGRHFPWGPGGMILRFSPANGWELMNNETSYGGIFFADTTEGWVTTTGIKHSVDGGLTWEWEHGPLPIHEYLYSLGFSDDGTGWACGESGYLCHLCQSVGNPELVPATCRVYPNPAKEFVCFEFGIEFSVPAVLEILDMTGHQLHCCNLLSGRGNIDPLIFSTEMLPNGFYLYRLSDGQHLFSGKLLILK
jgi:photosystem II stability/assembly factor-like uncharacterized protein